MDYLLFLRVRRSTVLSILTSSSASFLFSFFLFAFLCMLTIPHLHATLFSFCIKKWHRPYNHSVLLFHYPSGQVFLQIKQSLDQICASPPSTNSSTPVTKLLSFDARNEAAVATSSGLP